MPNLINAVRSLTKIIDEIKQMESEQAHLKKQIEEIQAKIQEVEDAENILQKICEEQQTIRDNLRGQGITFAAFLDRFHFKDVEDWKQPAQATLNANPPDYVNVVNNMKRYRRGISALNAQENQVLQKNREFLFKILNLAKHIEDRKEEVTFEETNLFA